MCVCVFVFCVVRERERESDLGPIAEAVARLLGVEVTVDHLVVCVCVCECDFMFQ